MVVALQEMAAAHLEMVAAARAVLVRNNRSLFWFLLVTKKQAYDMPAFFLPTFTRAKKRAFQQNADVTQRVRHPQSHQCSVGSELRLL